MNTLNKIEFYSTKGPYGCFSNFSKHSFYDSQNNKYLTSEHYFQSKKFESTIYEQKVMKLASPSQAAKMGRDRSLPLRKDWEKIKIEIMRNAIYMKFSQNKKIRDILLSTNNAILVEHTKNDTFWADGGDGKGKNQLGILLMELREKLRKENNDNKS